ncbi:MAG: FAD-binding protein, partial [Gammaproteobacteria bacterium]|nr:FAD-binding protein [Gammaproteobacteria bacterium]
MSCDVVIVGAGLAGLTAANEAIALGLSARIIEQGSERDYLCNSRLAGGIVHVAFKDMEADLGARQSAVADNMTADPAHDSATEHSQILADDSELALAWMKKQGARFIKGGALEFMRWVLAPPRPRRPGLDWK